MVSIFAPIKSLNIKYQPNSNYLHWDAVDNSSHESLFIYGLGSQIMTLSLLCPILTTYKAIQLLTKSNVKSREGTRRMSYFKVGNT